MQEFKMSMTEIYHKFTKSEIAIMSWTSQEQVINLEKKTQTKPVQKEQSNIEGDLPEHFYNEQGEVDLRRVTGKEAVKFLAAQGIRGIIPIQKKK